jgi:hypothetical protein
MKRPITITLGLTPADQLPDDEITVLGFTNDGGACPVYHLEDTWHDAATDTPCTVDYWCDFPEIDAES